MKCTKIYDERGKLCYSLNLRFGEVLVAVLVAVYQPDQLELMFTTQSRCP